MAHGALESGHQPMEAAHRDERPGTMRFHPAPRFEEENVEA